MERTRAKGDFASAYKLSLATFDKKAVRRERRSIEQKEIRIEGINKRRNLQDLSPLQEIDQTINSTHYKGKTPLKREETTSSEKVPSRLEQLKKWREERDKKRREEIVNSRNPVFKVGKTDHKDTYLYKKENLKKHPVKPVPIPDSIKVAATTKAILALEKSKLPVKAQKSSMKPVVTGPKTSQSVASSKQSQPATIRAQSRETKPSRASAKKTCWLKIVLLKCAKPKCAKGDSKH
ncbi:hypothetical protein DPMN_192632 [Dreissena polymorpha]|uniref:Uncharacterized protein n=1 Tax=Dreissena polymorpha TaxID=45954 RepID=A0A9D4BFV1_DREPO|nr:hypothetical protein DPMN_192632 [Dreissena polymorpha]